MFDARAGAGLTEISAMMARSLADPACKLKRPRRSAAVLFRGGAAAFTLVATMAPAEAAVPTPDRGNLTATIDSYRRPTDIPSPAGNPTTPAKAELGKMLFFDPRLSGSGTISCGTCHNPSLGWQDGLAKGVGQKGGQLGRRTPTILNTAWGEPMFWDGRARTLEDQAKGPLASETEMNMPHAQVVAQIKATPGYARAFALAYPLRPIDIDTVAMAIAAYERTVVSAPAPFDRWVAGDDGAISPAARRGFVVFNGKAGCVSCHSGWRFTDDGFHDIGLPDADLGRGKLMPNLQIMQHAFKTPTLRNTAERAPYMHDGSMATLEVVVDHYDHGFVNRPSLASQMKPLGLTAQERSDLLAFLHTLSSADEKVTLPTLPR